MAVTGTAAGVRERTVPPFPITATSEAAAMSTHTDRRAPASTFLTHYFGGGLIDEGGCYVVERFKAMASGEIRHWPGTASANGKARARTRPKPVVASVDEVREMRPAYNEIIVCTGLGTQSGIQYWGGAACGLFADRTRKR